MANNITIKLIAAIELEDKVTETLRDFESDIKQVTFFDTTREIRKDPKLLEQIRYFIKMKSHPMYIIDSSPKGKNDKKDK